MLKRDQEQLDAEYEHFEVENEAMLYNLTIRGFKGEYGTFYHLFYKYIRLFDCLVVYGRMSNFSAIRRLSPLPVTVLQI
jgi:hypothetical protein